ncbi:MAG: PepSY domain-containing protein [Helicobacteraceae bacterium]|jgi:sulfite reductase (NADPH) flavoprotein alpha-component|nr:PepSY domain-containing protein [Helicobacteraceae bacterium]
MTQQSQIQTKSVSTISLKRLLKQTHKILGIVFCIPIVIIGVTGAALSYSNELSRLELNYLEKNKSGEVLSVERTLQRFLEQRPNAKLHVLGYDGENEPLGIRASFDKEKADPSDIYTLYKGTLGFYSVSRYDGEILPAFSDRLFRAITLLHVSLDYSTEDRGEIGEEVVAISTLVIVLLSIMGLYFYIPMLKRNFSRNMKIDLKSKGHAFWYKLHSVTGVYTFAFVLLMSLSGLYFTYDWVRTLFHGLIGYESEPYEIVERVERIPKPFDFDETVKAFQIAIDNMPKGNNFLFWIPDKMNEPYSAAYKKRDYNGYGGADNINIDMQNNAIKYNSYSDEPIKEKILSSISQLHYGTFFGEIGKALWCVSSLSMALFGVSGIMMFYRRNKKTARAPQ